jgi:hypothetical protein
MVLGHKRSVRATQPAAHGGPGTHFQSPLKRGDKHKKQIVRGVGRAQRSFIARQQFEALLRREPISNTPDAASTVLVDEGTSSDAYMADWIDVDEPLFVPPPPPPPSPPQKPSEGAAQRLNDAWNRLLPQLENPWLRFYERTMGKPRDIIPAVIQHECIASCEASTVSKVKCLYPTCM